MIPNGWFYISMLVHSHFIGLPSGYVKIAIENGHRNSGFSQL